MPLSCSLRFFGTLHESTKLCLFSPSCACFSDPHLKNIWPTEHPPVWEWNDWCLLMENAWKLKLSRTVLSIRFVIPLCWQLNYCFWKGIWSTGEGKGLMTTCTILHYLLPICIAQLLLAGRVRAEKGRCVLLLWEMQIRLDLPVPAER